MRTYCPALFLTLLAACLPALTIADSGPVGLGTACNLALDVDTCASAGYVCTIDNNSAFGGSCEYPEYADLCLPSVGCDPDAGNLQCFEFSADGGRLAVQASCGTACKVPTDCVDATSTCFDAFLGDGGLGGACSFNACPNAYASCPVADGGVGTCIPFSPDQSFCNQSGPLPANSTNCSETVVDGGVYLCQPNDLCVDSVTTGATWCAASCGGMLALTCPSGTTCVSEKLLCLTPCNSASVCTSPFKCQEVIGFSGPLGNYCTLP